MAGKAWAELKKREVLEAYALSENYAAVSRETGVPVSSVSRWCKENAAEIERIKKRNKEIAEKAIEEGLEERMGEIARLGRDLRAKVRQLLPKVRRATPSGVATLARAAVDIELRGLGRPSEILELRGRVLDECIERELARLAAAGEERVLDATSKGSQGD